MHSDKKTDFTSDAQGLCGIAYKISDRKLKGAARYLIPRKVCGIIFFEEFFFDPLTNQEKWCNITLLRNDVMSGG